MSPDCRMSYMLWYRVQQRLHKSSPDRVNVELRLCQIAYWGLLWGVGGDDNNISDPLMKVAAGTIPCKYPTCTSVIIELTWADKDVRRSRQSLLPLINHESAVLHACFWKGTPPTTPTTTTHGINSVYEHNFYGTVCTIIPTWYCN